MAILDDELVHVLASRNVQLAREAGALATLPAALSFLSITSVLMGELATAGELADESTAITRDIGGVQLRHAHIILSAWRGDEAETTALGAHTAQDPAHPDEGTDASMARYAKSVLHNGLGNYAAAQEAASRACDSPELSLSSASLPEYVEACVRAGDPAQAEVAVDELELASARVRNGVGEGAGRAVAGTDQHGPVRRGTLPGGDRAAAQLPDDRLPRPHAPRLRRVAPPRGPPPGRPRAAAYGPPDVVGHGSGGVRRARCPGAAGHR